MDFFKAYFCNWLLLFIIWLPTHQDVRALQRPPEASSNSSIFADLAVPPTTGIFDPIEISPAVVPLYPNPEEPISPMYPSFPTTHEPVLTGKCPVDFSVISTVVDKTSSDCSAPLAAYVGNVICCPQVNSLLHIFLGHYSSNSSQLVMQNVTANYCFSDIISMLASRGANITIPELCSVKSSNLTGGTCPVKDAPIFEKMVNTSKLLDACNYVDPLKECCRPVCQHAISDAALRISLRESTLLESNRVGEPGTLDVLSDCKSVVYSWLSRKLSLDAASNAFRILSACKVNKDGHYVKESLSNLNLTKLVIGRAVCPLEFKQPSEVIKACRDLAAPNPSCCSSLNTYIVGIQKQMLITNRQAINCATLFGSMLKRGGVMTNIYELCDVDLKDFSLQASFSFSCHVTCYLSTGAAYGQEGCLLRSLPSDVIIDNTTGFSFTCDLSDNVAAPWPSSSSVSSMSLCAPEMSLPALPTLKTSMNPVISLGCLSFKEESGIAEVLETGVQYLLLSFTHGRGLTGLSQPIYAVNNPDLDTSVTNMKDIGVTLRKAKVVVESCNDDTIQVRVDLTGKDTQKVFNDVLTNLARTAPAVPGFRRQKGERNLTSCFASCWGLGAHPGKTSNVPKDFLVKAIGEARVIKFVIQEIVSMTMTEYVEEARSSCSLQKQEKLNVSKEFKTIQTPEELEQLFEPGNAFGFNATLTIEKVETEATTSSSSSV
ncbi:hypothetical protein IFM89_034931 [Coptis chinensis]|uniref:peptidylprolyl isomerase n=1 Tax=Coptis chinensis TaxID=261450 RepID=A0A835I860_9MAGN|nr:hypothetical protein IFM89_034931 [Coptis chinensis]